jgi:hypothetical protein
VDQRDMSSTLAGSYWSSRYPPTITSKSMRVSACVRPSITVVDSRCNNLRVRAKTPRRRYNVLIRFGSGRLRRVGSALPLRSHNH